MRVFEFLFADFTVYIAGCRIIARNFIVYVYTEMEAGRRLFDCC
jgi:hypothetical protein